MLRWYPQLSRFVVYRLNTSPANPRRFFLYNYQKETIEREFDTSDDCGGCFDLSPDGKLLAVKYGQRRQIDVVDVATGDVLFGCGPSRVSEVKFDATSHKLLAKGDSGLFVHALDSPGQEIKIGQAGDIRHGCFIPGDNHYLVPSRRKGQILRVMFDAREFERVSVDLQRTVKCIRRSPASGELILLDRSRVVVSYNSMLDEVKWRVRIKPVPNDGQAVGAAFSGNGRLIGVAVVHRSGRNTIVLDAETGDVRDSFIGVSPGRYPFAEYSTLSPMGVTLDLSTGMTSDTYTQLADY